MQHTFFLISKKQICTCSTLLCLSLAVVLHDYNAVLYDVKLPSYIEELSYMLTQYFASCIHVRFKFSLSLIFTLLAASICHFSPPLWISMFFFLHNSSPLFSITRSSSFSVFHVSVKIKNNAQKDTTLLLGGHVISFQTKPWVAFGLP